MILTDDARIENARRRSEWIDCRINSQLDDLARQRCDGVQVRKCGRWRRIGIVVGRHIDGLDRSDRSGLGGSDALLHLAHFRCQIRLITDRGRHASQKGGHFGTSLSKSENVVDEEQHVHALIAEVFSDGETRQRHAQTRAGWFSHLAID